MLLRNIKYTQMHHFRRKIHKFSPQRGPRKCLGIPWECFPRPRCGSWWASISMTVSVISKLAIALPQHTMVLNVILVRHIFGWLFYGKTFNFSCITQCSRHFWQKFVSKHRVVQSVSCVICIYSTRRTYLQFVFAFEVWLVSKPWSQ